jgi:hypothetical protein
MIEKRSIRNKVLAIIALSVIVALISYCYAVPIGPTVTYRYNTTKATAGGRLVNYTGNDTTSPSTAGGFIFTINLASEQQNSRWKGYVGNVTGTLVLDDADGYSLYDWQQTTATAGYIFATRASGTINWSRINCSNNGSTTAEMLYLQHTNNPTDNISRTFNNSNNAGFSVGTVSIAANSCPTTNLYVNASFPEYDQFEEMVLYDGPTTYDITAYPTGFRNIVFAAKIEQDKDGYRAALDNQTYDFEMILPENASTTWQSSIPYYFYVELS